MKKILILMLIAVISNVKVSDGFSFAQLENRKGNLLIEFTHGVVTSPSGAGVEINHRGLNNYIFYGSGHEVGQHMLTMTIYNPATNYTDDIVFIKSIEYNKEKEV